MGEKKKYYITTAIAYASGKPHIGNTYEIILADAIARFKREEGYDVYFMTGSDEHGQKIENKAKEVGKPAIDFVDERVADIKKNWDLMDTSYDKFMRTTDVYHKKQVQKMFRKFYEQGDIYKGCYEGLYCTPCESFFTESQLVDRRCPDCGGEVQKAQEEAYFFKMSKYADRLIAHIQEHPEFIQPVSRKNEMMNNFLLPGLQDLCVSRTSFSWGIPVDFDPKHITYVWLDALSNYITGIGFDVDGKYEERYKKYWPADLHLIGKDIVRFHTIYWPIFLMALDIPLPKQIFGHPFLMQGEGKMSKSKGNVMYADDLVDVFGVDVIRYFVLHEMPFDNDGIITWDLLVERFNSDLANVLGNLVSRTIAMSNKYFSGVFNNTQVKDIEGFDTDLKSVVLETVSKVCEKMDSLHIADAIGELWNIFKRCNKYIDETMPWVLAKEESQKPRLQTVLYNLAEAITIGASLLESFMPSTSKKILEMLGSSKRELTKMNQFGLLENGTKVIKKPEILFARLDLQEVLERAEAKLGVSLKWEEKEVETLDIQTPDTQEKIFGMDIEEKDIIEYEDFAKLQMQVGKIIACEEVPKSKKLLCSKVQIGSQIRQILSGIKAWYKPEDIIGKDVIVLVNLKPRKIAGQISEGMILCAEDNEGNLSLIAPTKAMKTGSEIC